MRLLRNGVMAAQEILVLLVRVRISVPQQAKENMSLWLDVHL